MSVIIVVGGQYGSEGKGKLVAFLANNIAGKVSVVRCGGTNSGHTVDLADRSYVLRQLPSGVQRMNSPLYLGAGMVIDPDLLIQEISDLGIEEARVGVDRNAVILDKRDLESEAKYQLLERVGSTLSGTGSATARKVLRDPSLKVAASHPKLQRFVTDVSKELNEAVDRGENIVVEGTQGVGLSLHHSRCYPFVTSRDTTAAAFLSEVGLSPRLVKEIVLVLRTYPIRVAGNSGPLRREISWEEVSRRAGAPNALVEYTSVTGRIRRVGEFDWELAEEAVRINRPTSIAIHGIDYLNYSDRSARFPSDLSYESQKFIRDVEDRLGVAVHYVFTGPRVADLINVTEDHEANSVRQVKVGVIHG